MKKKEYGCPRRILYEDRYELKEAFKNKCWNSDMPVSEGLKIADIGENVWSHIASLGMTPRVRARILKFIEQDINPKVESKPSNTDEWYFVEEPKTDEPKKGSNKITHLRGSVSYKKRDQGEIDTTTKVLYTVAGITQTNISKLFGISTPSVNKRLMRLLSNDK